MKVEEQSKVFLEAVQEQLAALSFSFNQDQYKSREFGERIHFMIYHIGKERYQLNIYHGGKDDNWYEVLVVKQMCHITGTFREELFRVVPVTGYEEWELTTPFYSRTLRGTQEGCAKVMLRLTGIMSNDQYDSN